MENNNNLLGAEALRRGRPSKETAKLNYSINLKLTEKDFLSVKEKAEKLGMKPTQYAREMTLKGQVKSHFSIEELDLVRKISGMANNLNQLARLANGSGYPRVASEMISIISEIKKMLHHDS